MNYSPLKAGIFEQAAAFFFAETVNRPPKEYKPGGKIALKPSFKEGKHQTMWEFVGNMHAVTENLGF